MRGGLRRNPQEPAFAATLDDRFGSLGKAVIALGRAIRKLIESGTDFGTEPSRSRWGRWQP